MREAHPDRHQMCTLLSWNARSPDKLLRHESYYNDNSFNEQVERPTESLDE